MVEILCQHYFTQSGSFLMFYWQCHVLDTSIVSSACLCVWVCVYIKEFLNPSMPKQILETVCLCIMPLKWSCRALELIQTDCLCLHWHTHTHRHWLGQLGSISTCLEWITQTTVSLGMLGLRNSSHYHHSSVNGVMINVIWMCLSLFQANFHAVASAVRWYLMSLCNKITYVFHMMTVFSL